jgi:hypothetical protein
MNQIYYINNIDFSLIFEYLDAQDILNILKSKYNYKLHKFIKYQSYNFNTINNIYTNNIKIRNRIYNDIIKIIKKYIINMIEFDKIINLLNIINMAEFYKNHDKEHVIFTEYINFKISIYRTKNIINFIVKYYDIYKNLNKLENEKFNKEIDYIQKIEKKYNNYLMMTKSREGYYISEIMKYNNSGIIKYNSKDYDNNKDLLKLQYYSDLKYVNYTSDKKKLEYFLNILTLENIFQETENNINMYCVFPFNILKKMVNFINKKIYNESLLVFNNLIQKFNNNNFNSLDNKLLLASYQILDKDYISHLDDLIFGFINYIPYKLNESIYDYIPLNIINNIYYNFIDRIDFSNNFKINWNIENNYDVEYENYIKNTHKKIILEYRKIIF